MIDSSQSSSLMLNALENAVTQQKLRKLLDELRTHNPEMWVEVQATYVNDLHIRDPRTAATYAQNISSTANSYEALCFIRLCFMQGWLPWDDAITKIFPSVTKEFFVAAIPTPEVRIACAVKDLIDTKDKGRIVQMLQFVQNHLKDESAKKQQLISDQQYNEDAEWVNDTRKKNLEEKQGRKSRAAYRANITKSQWNKRISFRQYALDIEDTVAYKKKVNILAAQLRKDAAKNTGEMS